jgi:hypothetical protein
LNSDLSGMLNYGSEKHRASSDAEKGDRTVTHA